jgi:hypothetical protein
VHVTPTILRHRDEENDIHGVTTLPEHLDALLLFLRPEDAQLFLQGEAALGRENLFEGVAPATVSPQELYEIVASHEVDVVALCTPSEAGAAVGTDWSVDFVPAAVLSELFEGKEME